MELLIKSAKILMEGRLEERDLFLEDGKIAEIGTSLKGKGISAKGLIAIPGAIDAHVHFREPGQTQKEDYRSGSQAAAAGGVTSVLTMPNVNPPIVNLEALEELRQLAKKSIINYGFHFGSTETNLGEIEQAKNIASVKLYLGHSTGNMMVSEETVKRILEKVPQVVIHAEDQSIIDGNAKALEGDPSPEKHTKIRTTEAAIKALKDFFHLKGKARVHLAHASTADEVFLAKENKATVEVTPHHLFLNTNNYKELGNKLKVNPSVREKPEMELLWKHLDRIDIIATDHAPHLLEEKDVGYDDCPSGLPGVQTMMPLMLDAVNRNLLTLPRLVELISINPSKVFGIQGKGHLKIGYDADITLIDLKQEHTIKDDQQFSKCGWTPYDGWKVSGKVMMTLANGVLAYDGTPQENQGRELRFSR